MSRPDPDSREARGEWRVRALSPGDYYSSLGFLVPTTLRRAGQVLRRFPALEADVEPAAPKPSLVPALKGVQLFPVAPGAAGLDARPRRSGPLAIPPRGSGRKPASWCCSEFVARAILSTKCGQMDCLSGECRVRASGKLHSD